MDMAIKINMNIIINKDIVSRLIDEEYYIVDSKNHILHSLNETGTFIFKQFKKNSSFKDIIKALCSEFEVNENEAIEDLNEFIRILKEKKILA